jgi:hypothetical protein
MLTCLRQISEARRRVYRSRVEKHRVAGALGEHLAPNALAAELIKARGAVLPASPGPGMYDWEPQR